MPRVARYTSLCTVQQITLDTNVDRQSVLSATYKRICDAMTLPFGSAKLPLIDAEGYFLRLCVALAVILTGFWADAVTRTVALLLPLRMHHNPVTLSECLID